MIREFKLPELGENIESADVISVLVKVGDRLEKDQSIIEIETDKATIEVPSSLEGIISEVLVKGGDTIQVGSVIIKVDEEGDTPGHTAAENEIEETNQEANVEIPSPTKEVPDAKKSLAVGKAETVDFVVPDLGENIETADVVEVLVKPGDMLARDQGVIEIETDKATIEVPSNIEGKIIEVKVETGSTVQVGDIILKVESDSAGVKAPSEHTKIEKTVTTETFEPAEIENQSESTGTMAELQPGEFDRQPPITKGSAPAAPSVRRIAREIGVDINEVKGSGSGGRISMDDVKAYSKKLHQERKSIAGFGIKQEPLPDFTKFGKIEKIGMSKIRKVTADHLSYAWVTIPHVTQFDKADITQLEKLRKEVNSKLKPGETKLTVTAILTKIIASALKEFPQFNCSINMDTKEIIYKKYYNVGIAVDTERGLIVPVIKNADTKNLKVIVSELNSLAEKARDKKISLEELQGGCITITNLGGIGGTSFTPVVNSPEVAILGVSRGGYEPVYNKSGDFEPGLMLPLSLSYDHRIIDGADAVRFLNWLIDALEKPSASLIEEFYE